MRHFLEDDSKERNLGVPLGTRWQLQSTRAVTLRRLATSSPLITVSNPGVWNKGLPSLLGSWFLLSDVGSVINCWSPGKFVLGAPRASSYDLPIRGDLHSLVAQLKPRGKQNYASEKGAGILSQSSCTDTWVLSFFHPSLQQTFTC